MVTADPIHVHLNLPDDSLGCVQCAGVPLVLVLQSSPQHKEWVGEGGSHHLAHGGHAHILQGALGGGEEY